MDWHDGHFYMTLPLMRYEQIVKGKGKNSHKITVARQSTIWVNDAGEWGPYDEEHVNELGFLFPSNRPVPDKLGRWLIKDLQPFLDHQKNGTHIRQRNPSDIFLQLQSYYRTYIEFSDDIYYTLLPLYIMGSYVFRLFPSIAYLHFNGTAATGKSQNLKMLNAFAFNCYWATNMTESTLFRTAEGIPGLICIDEAESFDGERGQEIRKLLNAGYKAGESVPRSEKTTEGAYDVQHFDVFTPKAIASINSLEPVIQSRCIVIGMQPALTPRPEFHNEDPRWAETRSDLYHWAMQSANDVRATFYEWNDGLRFTLARNIVNRQWEVAQIFLVLAAHIGLDTAPLVTFFEGYFAKQQRAQDETNRQQILLKAMPEVFRTKTIHHGGEWWAIKDIHEVVSGYLEADAREYYKTRSTSKHLTALGFTARRTDRNGTLAQMNEETVREQYRKRHIEPAEDDVAWLEGTVSYVEPRLVTQTVAPLLWQKPTDD